MRTPDLFDTDEFQAGGRVVLGPQSWVLRGFALPYIDELLPALETIQAAAPFRRMVTPGGYTMSVALTNCGRLGWVSDRRGYRYSEQDPLTGLTWPAMPTVFLQLAGKAAAEVGFDAYVPDACLINRYLPGSRLSLHQDRDERDRSAPIVSVSLGVAATFQFGGLTRRDKLARTLLEHGDVAVWGGVDRMRYHGILPIKPDRHPLLGAQRINFTFRKVM